MFVARQCLGTRRIPDLKTLWRESGAWNQRISRARTKIAWRFDRNAQVRLQKKTIQAVRDLVAKLTEHILAVLSIE